MSTSQDRHFFLRSQLKLVAILLLVVCSQTTFADELAVWNFNDSNLTVDHGSGTLTTNVAGVNVSFAAGTTTNGRQGDVAGQSLQLQGGSGTVNNGRDITFNVSTLGFTDIVVSFATQGTSTGFNNNQFQYSLDGVNFINFGAPYVPAAAFGTIPVVFSLNSIAGLNNNPAAAFRILFGGATSATGNNRIDNIVVEGMSTTIPEPATMVLLITGMAGLGGLRAKRKALTKDP